MKAFFETFQTAFNRIINRDLLYCIRTMYIRLRSFWVMVRMYIAVKCGRAEHTLPWLRQHYEGMSDRKEFIAHVLIGTPSFLEPLLHLIGDQNTIKWADDLYFQKYSLYGSPLVTYKAIPWNSDITMREDDLFFKKRYFPSKRFSPFIKFYSNTSLKLAPDATVPLHLGTLFHGILLTNAAYVSQRQIYALLFFHYMKSFWKQNRYMQGINWIHSWNVGLRAITMVMSFYKMYAFAAVIPPGFWERYVASLFDHLHYLETHWQYRYKKNHEYICHLIGYYSILFLYRNLEIMYEKARWCYKELLQELRKQISPDGTLYTGSTSYHRLVTELCYVAYQMTLEFGFEAEEFRIILEQMINFVRWMLPDHGEFIQIGDTGIDKVFNTNLYFNREITEITPGLPNAKEWPYFGLSAYRTKQFHITLRHHVYRQSQPSGNFHADVASITLAYNGVPFIVDPGTFLYEASTPWRNQFRSFHAHSTFWFDNSEPIVASKKLFTLNIPQAAITYQTVEQANDQTELITQHDLFASVYGLKVFRTIKVPFSDQQCTITDSWQEVSPAYRYKKPKHSVHMFVLHPDIVATIHNSTTVRLTDSDGKTILVTTSASAIISIKEGWYSPSYHQKRSTKQLMIQQPYCDNGSVSTLFEPIKT